MNQCDGCRRGLPVTSHGVHPDPDVRDPWDYQVCCTKDRYVVPSTDAIQVTPPPDQTPVVDPAGET